MFSDHKQDKPITIVSGLPRSGTSMMMKMLEAGGLLPLTDNIRAADSDNPRGYYEFERVKKLKEGDNAWLVDAQGKVVKVIATLLLHLPATYTYRIIFMHRAMAEILASQTRMLEREGKPSDKASEAALARSFDKHLHSVEAWLAEQPNFEVMYVSYNEIIANPVELTGMINQFHGHMLDEEKMARVVDPTLYRQHVSIEPG